MRVLVGCEFSGRVRDAFIAKGHDAVSCDLLPSEVEGPHIQGNILDILDQGWDMLISFPPCTHLCSSGARHFYKKKHLQDEAISLFVKLLWYTDIPKVCLENPVGVVSTRFRKPDQIIQPWMFGLPETKATCLWLEGLPLLQPGLVVSGRYPRVHMESPGPDRWKNRSRTNTYLALEMAAQWG